MKLFLPTAAFILCLILLVPPSSAVLAAPGCPEYDISEPGIGFNLQTNAAGQAQLDVAGGLVYVVFDDLDVFVDTEHFLNPEPSMRWIFDSMGVLEASSWVYQERNGVPGLQRYDAGCKTSWVDASTADEIVLNVADLF